ncbi:PspC domain-containing protein [Dysgonomonas sp. 216]|uniref:PspC domain-containing protein n=1 Tax=Dysgonomonas sp. 216 TaxID=2302934 RepID=UPI0013D5F335|nr:PspC domain-containing protein [Dysgonomonas sp. 216]NDW18973.1 PspC domain-containing protein [Dysgonomonas sp. 216]
MKKVVEVSIGGISFTMEDDAYYKLKNYLNRFESSIEDKNEVKEVMEDVEARVAEIFLKEKKYQNQVIDVKIVDIVISHMGEIDTESQTKKTSDTEQSDDFGAKNSKKLYRNPDDKKIAGVCSGLSVFFGLDVTIIRIIFLVALICYGSTLIIYIVLWLATNEALSIPQKLEMRGIPVTAENIRKYTANRK